MNERTHALEETRPELAFQNVSQISWRMHAILLRFRIKIGFGRCEQHVHVLGLQLFDVVLQRARVFIEVFVWSELQPVHEDTGNDRIAMLARQPHERQVAFVQVTHGRDEGGSVLAAQLVAQFMDRADDFHLADVSWQAARNRAAPSEK